ncbi:stimulus-sensing domain-containing protein [uncultured Maricaulis sp.]|uniref:stimulus-sensing domain-containing protein n=1 Tax=uncultured Maricaulis sp. TaxID=174710 RepID=UPI0030DDC331|tara:strand:- start:94555 stop:96177 length:1623 start_codon:yes stop_codon:yes gene_type:complete
MRETVRRVRAFLRGLTPRASSRLAQWILMANFVALGVLVLGMLALTETRQGLVNAKLDSLRSQGELIANVLAEGASVGSPAPALRNSDARALLRQLYVPAEARVLVFDKGGAMVADSHLLADVFETTVLPPAGADPDGAAETARSLPLRLLDGFANILRSPEERLALNRDLQDEVRQAIAGEIIAGVRRESDGRRVVSVSIPIQPVRAIIGVVTIESYDLDRLIDADRQALLPFMLIAALVTAMSSLALTVFIARPIRRLARAAHEARRAGGRRVKMPDLRARKDEIGELGVALSEMTDALYDRLDAIESFAADVAHELKNPLTSIRSAAETLPKAKDDVRRDRLLAVITADVTRLDRLITDISRASRVDAELAREDVSPFDLGGLLQSLAETYNDTPANSTPVIFESQVRNSHVLGREGPLGQVFRNLIDNAITFSPVGGKVYVTAMRGQREPHTTLLITVDDDGPGIPADNLEAVFDRFYTERPAGAAFGTHSGLGLAISRQIAKAHGGRITASNRLDATGACLGARFTVELPAAPAH